MRPTLIHRALRRSLSGIRHVNPVPPGAATGLVGAVYAQVERDFGMLAPPVALHSPAPDVLAASWMLLRETLLATGTASRAAKEAVATAVSRDNACPYCVEVHTSALVSLGEPPQVAAELARCAAGDGHRDLALPMPPEQHRELLGVATTFQYMNRMVNVFLGESPLPPSAPGAAHRFVSWFLGRLARRGTTAVPGDSLGLLPDTPLPTELSWATGNEAVAGAFARAGAAMEAAGRRAVPPEVRDLVLAELDGWTGGPPGLSRSWVERPLAGVPAAARPAARLALLTALASYQVDQTVVDGFRRDRPDDCTLVETTAWASFAAARQAGKQYTTGGALHDPSRREVMEATLSGSTPPIWDGAS